MTSPRIPLVLPSAAPGERAYVSRAIESRWLRGGGPFTRACEQALEDATGSPRAVLTSSCTAALHLAGQALGIGPGSEVVVPAYAFASCASVFLSLGATVRFADCRADAPLVDANAAAPLVGPGTKAILVIHYAGLPCEMDALLRLAAERRIALIEDAAHALFGRYRGKRLGGIGTLGAASFDYAKNVTCGEGGALFVNDETLYTPVEIAYQRGTNRAAMLRGEASRYEWLGQGGHCEPSELQAAFLLSQLEEAAAIQQRRQEVWHQYMTRLASWADANGVGLPRVPPGAEPGYHLFYLLFPDARRRDAAIAHLARHGIESATHYSPLHVSPAGRRLGGAPGMCPNAERFGDTLLRIPLHARLADEDVDQIVEALLAL